MMKRTLRAAVGLVLIATAGLTVGVGQEAVPVERSPHETTWQYATQGWDVEGNPITTTNSYVQVATGLNRFDATTQQFVPASAEIEVVNGVGVIRQAQHSAIISANANDLEGVLDLEMPDGKRLIMQTIGVAVTDPDTGASTFLGEVKDSIGIVEGNTVTFPDAFDNLSADIVIHSRLSGIESDIVIKERIDRAWVQAQGVDPERARIEVWHQVLQNPGATKRVDFIMRGGGREDENHVVDFGSMVMPDGRAFRSEAGGQLEPGNDKSSVVAKEWVTIEGLDFLIESVPFTEAEAELQALPAPVEARTVPKDAVEKALAAARKGVRRKPVSVAQREGTPKPAAEKAVASLGRGPRSSTGPSYVLDYLTINTSQTNYTWKGDTTYYVSDIVNLMGKTTLGAGAVIKMAPYTNSGPAIYVYGDFDCQTAPYAPAVFTAKDDNSVGEIISGSTGNPTNYYGYYNICLEHSTTNTTAVPIHDIRSSFAHTALGLHRRSGTTEAWNIQLYSSDKGVEVVKGDVRLQNALIQKTRYAIIFSASTTSKKVDAEHVTIRTTEKFFHYSNGSDNALNLTNSIIVGATNGFTATVSSNYVVGFTNEPALFATMANGANYLAAGSPYRDYGTTTVSSRMAQILKNSTTEPPTLLTNIVTADTTLYPTVQRDIGTPDLGYHYAPLDYLWGSLYVTNNTTLTLKNGTAAGVFDTTSTYLRGGAKFVSEGLPQRLNALVAAVNVQEQPQVLGSTGASKQLFNQLGVNPSVPPEVSARFTEFAVLGNDQAQRSFHGGGDSRTVALSHCVLRNVHLADYTYLTAATVKLMLTNNLLERVRMETTQNSGGTNYNVTFAAYNNLFRFGHNAFVYKDTSTAWWVYDNLFVECTTSETLVSTPKIPNNYNAHYLTTALTSTGSSNKTLVALDFQLGALGSFYYPTNGSNLGSLANAGSRNASDATLYQFTTYTNQTKEAGTVVDIGMHYVAVDTSQLPDLVPLDSDGDGVPDFLEDANGNGTFDTGESDWNSSNNGTGGSATLVLFTQIE